MIFIVEMKVKTRAFILQLYHNYIHANEQIDLISLLYTCSSFMVLPAE